MTAKAIEHGTYRGYQQHRRRSVGPCDECRAAAAAYARDNRAARPHVASRNSRVNAARLRALRRLAELHPEDMRRLYAQERAASGIVDA